MIVEPSENQYIYHLDKYFKEIISLFNKDRMPNKIIFSGKKGLGKSTLAYHIINYILSKDEEFGYDIEHFKINPENRSFKTILNNSNLNFRLITINQEKKIIDINQIRELISNLNKSSFNKKPRFVLIDNIEFLNTNSINALLKILEEPSFNVHFILINNNKKILPTLLSRCINFKVHLSNKQSLNVANELLNGQLYDLLNEELINYYSAPENLYNLVNFAEVNKYDLSEISLKEFLEIIINNRHYKKDSIIQYLVFDLIEFYLRKINLSFTSEIHEKYVYFLKRISTTKKFNLDMESLFMEFEEKILNG